LAFEIEKERRHAIELEPDLAGELEELDQELPERSEAGEAFSALSSSAAELDDAILAQTTMQLFATDDFDHGPGPEKSLAPAPAARKPLKSLAPKSDSAYAVRERLREERKELVADVSRRTGESYQQINARINQVLGVASVSKATREELERGNALLERDLKI
ncbi:MAG TPA: hypothetical protein P5138_09030, partial [Solirubrobacterales bacterium]|nr:hypothetical protein [Solirubrobacterales bacterium]